MIIPKGIKEYIKNNSKLNTRFKNILDSNEKLNVTNKKCNDQNSKKFYNYLFKTGYLESNEIRRFVFYMTSLFDIFENILLYFDKVNPISTHRDDVRPAGTLPEELLHHAMYIYYLDSYGINGDIVECGAFKGFSACCLSWVCHFFGRTLIVADSFEGLPANKTDPYYKAGDFKGTFEEVERNIVDLGKKENVQFIKGFFKDSLRNYKNDIVLIWMDVDLYESATDVIENLLPRLKDGGVIISHELFEERDFRNNQLRKTIGPAKALSEYVDKKDIHYKAIPFINGSGLIVPHINSNEKLIWSEKVFSYLVENIKEAKGEITKKAKVMEIEIKSKIEKLEKENEALKESLYDIQNCLSFKIGKGITSPFRFFKTKY